MTRSIPGRFLSCGLRTSGARYSTASSGSTSGRVAGRRRWSTTSRTLALSHNCGSLSRRSRERVRYHTRLRCCADHGARVSGHTQGHLTHRSASCLRAQASRAREPPSEAVLDRSGVGPCGETVSPAHFRGGSGLAARRSGSPSLAGSRRGERSLRRTPHTEHVTQHTEVDFLNHREREYAAIQVKSQLRYHTGMLPGLRAVSDLAGIVRACSSMPNFDDRHESTC